MKRILVPATLAMGLMATVLLAGPVLWSVTQKTETPIVVTLDYTSRPVSPGSVQALAAGPEAQNEPAESPAEILFYEARGFQDQTVLIGVDLATGKEAFRIPNGQLTPDRERIISTRFQAQTTTIQVHDTRGTVLGTQTLDGRYFFGRSYPYGLMGRISPNGRWLGLDFFHSSVGDEEAGFSRIAVVDLTGATPVRYVDLIKGLFLVDGLSNDGNHLYLIERLADPQNSEHSGRYWVRLFNLRENRLLPDPVVEKGALENPQPMSGLSLDHVFSRDGEWQYTLYALGAEGHPFIHALPLNAASAVCLDLPGDHANPELETAYTLALSPHGHQLYAVNTALKSVTSIGLSSFGIRSALLEAPVTGLPRLLAGWLAPEASAKVFLQSGAVVSPDGKWLYAGGPDGIWVIDAARLETVQVLRPGSDALSLALDTSGERLFVADRDRIRVVDLASGQWSTLASGSNDILRLAGVVRREN